MRKIVWAALAILGLPTMGALHDQGCIPGQADPATINVIDLTGVGGPLYYDEERRVWPPFNTQPPIPMMGFMFGDGSWIWEEVNGLVGLQRRGLTIDEECLLYPHLPCVCTCDPLPEDEACGHGGDDYVF